MTNVPVLVFSDNPEAVKQNEDQQRCSDPEPSLSGEEEEEAGEEEKYEEGQKVEEETPEEEEVKVEWPTGVPQASDNDLAKLSIKEGVSLSSNQMKWRAPTGQLDPPLLWITRDCSQPPALQPGWV